MALTPEELALKITALSTDLITARKAFNQAVKRTATATLDLEAAKAAETKAKNALQVVRLKLSALLETE